MLAAADSTGVAGSMDHGPGVRLHLALADDGTISGAAFEVANFERARAPASALCDALVGASLAQARKVSAYTIARLAGLPEGSVAARTVYYAKSAAIKPLLARPAFADINITCTCFGIDAATILDTARRHGVRTVEELKQHLPASYGCGTCRPEVVEILAEAAGDADD